MIKQRIFRPEHPWRKPVFCMNNTEINAQLIRVLILQHQNGKSQPFSQWGWEEPQSMYLLRRRRLRLARQYAQLYEPVSALIFKCQLPHGKNWLGTPTLLSQAFFSWEGGVWAQRGCSIPFQVVRGNQFQSM